MMQILSSKAVSLPPSLQRGSRGRRGVRGGRGILRTPLFLHIFFSIILLILPLQSSATSTFSLFFDGPSSFTLARQVDPEIVKFIVEKVSPRGIRLTGVEDILAAQSWEKGFLCNNRQTTDGKTIDLSEGDCERFRQEILQTIRFEQDASQLGDDLLSIATSMELAIADEPHRLISLPTLGKLFTRLWTGSGSTTRSWPEDANDELAALEQAIIIDSEDPSFSKIVYRFRHGYFRDLREADPRLQDYGPNVQAKIAALAAALGIGNAGVGAAPFAYATPVLGIPNVELWARNDDLGLQWTVPVALPRFDIGLAGGGYPAPHPMAPRLAYPFSYSGNALLAGLPTESPLCSHVEARHGYLCEAATSVAKTCSSLDPRDDDIHLIVCDIKKKSTPEPGVCPNFQKIFTEKSGSLVPADPKTICDPQRMAVYNDEIPEHACYISWCLAQSWKSHAMVGGRSPVVAGEMTSPFTAFLRSDPKLGMFGEAGRFTTTFAEPEYLGHLLVADFDRAYCALNGYLPHPLAGFCAYNDNRRSASPLSTLRSTVASLVDEYAGLIEEQYRFTWLGRIMAQRIALEQAQPLIRAQTTSIAVLIQNVADLLKELRRAPITVDACPWTGPMPKISVENTLSSSSALPSSSP